MKYVPWKRHQPVFFLNLLHFAQSTISTTFLSLFVPLSWSLTVILHLIFNRTVDVPCETTPYRLAAKQMIISWNILSWNKKKKKLYPTYYATRFIHNFSPFYGQPVPAHIQSLNKALYTLVRAGAPPRCNERVSNSCRLLHSNAKTPRYGVVRTMLNTYTIILLSRTVLPSPSETLCISEQKRDYAFNA